MGEREGFLAAIAAAPDDDLARLVFADWLDEHDDPLGDFIRLQIELEPLRLPRADPRAELERVHLLAWWSSWSAFHKQDTLLTRKLDREKELLKAHRADWLGPAAVLDEDYESYFGPEFRRGFVSSASIGLSAFLEHGPALRQACPALQRLIVIGTLGRGESLAAQPALAGLPELVLAGWLTAADARALSKSPHLANLRSLTVWIGAEKEDSVCRALARLLGLRELVLVQMWGGLSARNPVVLDRRANRLAALANKERGEAIARVERPFARLYPLDGVHIGYGIDAGHLPGGQAVLVDEGKRPVLMYFNADGFLQREEQIDLSDRLVKPPPYSWEECEASELIEVLGKEIGFEPGPIFVREFESERIEVCVVCWAMHQDALAAPNQIHPAQNEEVCASLYWMWSTGQFQLESGDCYWADALGRIHSS
jgi:uncharacterized protein (TIGR02996 family)